MSLEELLNEALQLTPDERLRLADRLFQSVDNLDDAAIRDAWVVEIAKRIEDIDEGRVQLVEHDEALRRMFGDDERH